MKTYEYRGFDQAGQLRKGLVEALDLKEARERLAGRGILAEKVGLAGQAASTAFKSWSGSGFNTDTRAIVYRELQVLLDAGMHLTKALEILIDTPELGKNSNLLANVRDHIREGSGFAAAMESAGTSISSFEHSVLEAGEKAGALSSVLLRLAEFMEDQEELKGRIQTALIYPVIVIALACVVGAVMLGILLPGIQDILSDTNVAMPMITRVAMAVSDHLVSVGVPLVLVLVLAGWWSRNRWHADEQFRCRWDRKIFNLPVAGKLYAVLANLRFTRTLALLLRGGVTLPEGLETSGHATGSPWVAHRVLEEAPSLRQGDSLAELIRRIVPLNTSLPGWIQAGEASGNLVELLESAGTRYQNQWNRMIQRYLAVLEPVLILCVALFVLMIALAILLPILSINTTLG